MAVIELDDVTFDKHVEGTTPIVVDFWASWCGPCKMLAPVFDELSGEYDEKTLLFGKSSTEEHPDHASKHGISGIPALVVFKEGKEVDRIVGFAPKEAIKAKLDAILEKA